MTYKIINKLSPESLWDKFELRTVHSKFETRNCHDLQIPKLNTERAKNGFKYLALKLWNDIPADIPGTAEQGGWGGYSPPPTFLPKRKKLKRRRLSIHSKEVYKNILTV